MRVQVEEAFTEDKIAAQDEQSLSAAVCCLLQEFSVPAVKVVHSAELALRRFEVETGVVVDCGLAVTRATPVLNGKCIMSAVQGQFVGAANVTNFLVEELQRHIQPEVIAATDLSAFEIMLAVKATKEDQLRVASSLAEAQKEVPRTTVLRALSAAANHSVTCGNELTVAAEVFFSPSVTTGPHHSYYSPSSPSPTLGIHQLVHEAATAAGLPDGYAVSVIGGSAMIEGMGSRLESELCLLGAQNGCILPIIPEAGWAGGALVGCTWEPSVDK